MSAVPFLPLKCTKTFAIALITEYTSNYEE